MSYYNRLNKTTTPLTNGSTFLGSGEQTNKQGVFVSCFADKIGTLTLEWSADNTNFDFTEPYPIIPNTPLTLTRQNLGTFFRVRFLNNSGENQSVLRLHTRFVDDVPDQRSTQEHTLWGAVSVSTNSTSPEIRMHQKDKLSIYGTTDNPTTLTLQVRNSLTSFINTSHSLVANGNFYWELDKTTAPFCRLIVESGSSTISAYASTK